jgi:hypothetical protein
MTDTLRSGRSKYRNFAWKTGLLLPTTLAVMYMLYTVWYEGPYAYLDGITTLLPLIPNGEAGIEAIAMFGFGLYAAWLTLFANSYWKRFQGAILTLLTVLAIAALALLGVGLPNIDLRVTNLLAVLSGLSIGILSEGIGLFGLPGHLIYLDIPLLSGTESNSSLGDLRVEKNGSSEHAEFPIATMGIVGLIVLLVIAGAILRLLLFGISEPLFTVAFLASSSIFVYQFWDFMSFGGSPIKTNQVEVVGPKQSGKSYFALATWITANNDAGFDYKGDEGIGDLIEDYQDAIENKESGDTVPWNIRGNRRGQVRDITVTFWTDDLDPSEVSLNMFDYPGELLSQDEGSDVLTAIGRESNLASDGGTSEQEDEENSLDDIEGIGNAYSKRLENNGIETPQDLVDADHGRITDITNASQEGVTDWIEQAEEMTGTKQGTGDGRIEDDNEDSTDRISEESTEDVSSNDVTESFTPDRDTSSPSEGDRMSSEEVRSELLIDDYLDTLAEKYSQDDESAREEVISDISEVTGVDENEVLEEYDEVVRTAKRGIKRKIQSDDEGADEMSEPESSNGDRESGSDEETGRIAGESTTQDDVDEGTSETGVDETKSSSRPSVSTLEEKKLEREDLEQEIEQEELKRENLEREKSHSDDDEPVSDSGKSLEEGQRDSKGDNLSAREVVEKTAERMMSADKLILLIDGERMPPINRDPTDTELGDDERGSKPQLGTLRDIITEDSVEPDEIIPVVTKADYHIEHWREDDDTLGDENKKPHDSRQLYKDFRQYLNRQDNIGGYPGVQRILNLPEVLNIVYPVYFVTDQEAPDGITDPGDERYPVLDENGKMQPVGYENVMEVLE